jgi:hypothetical protein
MTSQVAGSHGADCRVRELQGSGFRDCGAQGSGGRAGETGLRRQGSGFSDYLAEEISIMEQFLNPES